MYLQIHSSSGRRWHIAVEQGSDDRENPDIVADWVISTAPAPQTAGIMPPSASFHQQLSEVKMQGCFTLMLGFDKNWILAGMRHGGHMISPLGLLRIIRQNRGVIIRLFSLNNPCW